MSQFAISCLIFKLFTTMVTILSDYCYSDSVEFKDYCQEYKFSLNEFCVKSVCSMQRCKEEDEVNVFFQKQKQGKL